MLKAVLLVAGLVFTSAAMAQYKWVDKNGKVQYGDTPPAGVNASALRPPSQPGSEPEAKKPSRRSGPASLAEKDAEFRKRQQDAEKERDKQAKADQEAQEKRENCARAQEHLRGLEAGQRVIRVDAKGERYFLDDAQVAQEKAKARQAAQQWCS
jgi:hypothetical protein